MYFVGIVLIIYFFAFLFVFWCVARNQDKDVEDDLGVKEKVRVRWWVTEDFTGCRGNVHSFEADLKGLSGSVDRLKELRKQIRKEFESKVSYHYDWEEIDE